MATPMTADQILAQLTKWGITYHEHTIGGVSWRNHNRNAVGAWGPVNGFTLHHTADDAPDYLDLDVCWNGRSDLPGPLCGFGLRDDGSLDLIGCGRTNHAGAGDPAVLKAVVDESYGDYPPAPKYHEGSPMPPAVDFNPHMYGCETYYSGGHPMTAAAYKTAVLLAAAICDFHSWSAKSAIGHKELSDWKIDPGCLDMAIYRRDVQATLDAGPAGQQKRDPEWPQWSLAAHAWFVARGATVRADAATQAIKQDGETAQDVKKRSTELVAGVRYEFDTTHAKNDPPNNPPK